MISLLSEIGSDAPEAEESGELEVESDELEVEAGEEVEESETAVSTILSRGAIALPASLELMDIVTSVSWLSYNLIETILFPVTIVDKICMSRTAIPSLPTLPTILPETGLLVSVMVFSFQLSSETTATSHSKVLLVFAKISTAETSCRVDERSNFKKVSLEKSPPPGTPLTTKVLES